MKNINLLLSVLSLFLLVAGCSSTPVPINSVGPAPASAAIFKPTGYLRVYTATESHQVAENTFYYPHTSYHIYDKSGTLVKYVLNHTGDTDQKPALERVPIGSYNVVAESESYGRVTVPVMIEEGKMTEIHLDRNWTPNTNLLTGRIVRLPDGEAVGWGSPSRNSN